MGLPAILCQARINMRINKGTLPKHINRKPTV